MAVAGLLSRSASRIVAKAANGFHLLRIDGYSQTKTVLPGQRLSSPAFTVGGHSWRIDYYPNGRDASTNHNAISVYLQLMGHTKRLLQARYKFSLLDHGGNTAYELPAENGSFTSVLEDNYSYHNTMGPFGRAHKEEEEDEGPGCGHEQFIGMDELERRDHLIRDDSILVRCDVGVTAINNEWLAHDELNTWGDEEESDEEGFEAPGYGAPRRRRRKRRANDGEYVKWCLAQRPGAGRR